MLPLLPFVAGLAVGIAAVKLYKNDKVHTELQKVGKTLRKSGASAEEKLRETSTEAQEKLRKAAVSSLSSIETSSARLREKLSSDKKNTDKPSPSKPPTAAKTTKPKASVRKQPAKRPSSKAKPGTPGAEE